MTSTKRRCKSIRVQAAIDRHVEGKNAPKTRRVGIVIPPKPKGQTGALCSLSGIPAASHIARERIAADVEAFQKRGGKIERLGTTKIFHHIDADNDE